MKKENLVSPKNKTVTTYGALTVISHAILVNSARSLTENHQGENGVNEENNQGTIARPMLLQYHKEKHHHKNKAASTKKRLKG